MVSLQFTRADERKSGSRAAALQEGAIFPEQSLPYLARKSREI
jgi:hypothetical protein